MLANGLGKARAARDGTARASAKWRLLFLSAGEESLSALMAQQDARQPQDRRYALPILTSMRVPAWAHWRLERIRESCCAHRNTQRRSRPLLRTCWRGLAALAGSERPKLAALIDDGVQRFIQKNTPANSTGQVERVARRFGLVAVAGEMATQAGLTGWQLGEAEEAAGKCFEAWMESFGGGIRKREDRALLSQVKRFFELHGASRFESVTKPTPNNRYHNRAGFFRESAEGE